jgi:hypothetical protein
VFILTGVAPSAHVRADAKMFSVDDFCEAFVSTYRTTAKKRAETEMKLNEVLIIRQQPRKCS